MSAKIALPHRLWRLLPANARRRALAHAAGLLAPRIDSAPAASAGGVIIAGELTRASGLGEAARLLLRATAKLGVAAWPVDVGPLLPAHRADLPQIESPADAIPGDAALLIHVSPPLLPIVLARLPRKLRRNRQVIGCWAWELETVPEGWRAGARIVHAAWAPSAFAAAAFETMLPGRVRTVPLPLAADPPIPARLDRAAFGLLEDAVVVLTSFNLASSFERKNPLAAVAAFRAAFGARRDRLLLLKVGNPAHWPADFARLRAAVGDAPNIRIETRVFPRADAAALMAAADIVLSLHRSEGLGLVPAEAMLLGRAVIATGWSGNLEFMDSESTALVPYRLISVEDPRGVYSVPGARWAEPDIDAASQWLRRLADDPALRAAMGARAAPAARARLGMAPVRAALAAIGAPLPP